MTAYAPWVGSYGKTEPYLTVTEYSNAPTAVDTSNLVAGGNAAVQEVALNELILRASSWIDSYTCNTQGTLNATLNTENARIWGNNRGEFRVHPKFWPILEVRTFAYSPTIITPTNGGASVTPANCIWIEPQQFVVANTATQFFGTSNLAGVFGIGTAEYYAEWTYVNGWPNTTLAASVSAGASSIQPTSVLGIYPNTPLNIFDMPSDESVMVSSTYVPGATTVPLTTPLVYTHLAGAVTTNIPMSVKQAAILIVTSFVKQRGTGALIYADLGGSAKPDFSRGAQDNDADIALALTLLDPYKQQVVGS